MFSFFMSNMVSSGVNDILSYMKKLKLVFRIFGYPFGFRFGSDSGLVIRIQKYRNIRVFQGFGLKTFVPSLRLDFQMMQFLANLEKCQTFQNIAGKTLCCSYVLWKEHVHRKCRTFITIPFIVVMCYRESMSIDHQSIRML